MFFCDKCAEKNKWPKGFAKSRGRCDICGEVAMCSDIPSKNLPMPVKETKAGSKR